MQEILVPKAREIENNEIECPIIKMFSDVTNRERVSLLECKNCKNFVGIRDNKVLCAYAWI